MSKPIEVKKLGLGELIALRGYIHEQAYSSPVRESEAAAERRFARQEALRGKLKLIDLELRRRTKDLVV